MKTNKKKIYIIICAGIILSLAAYIIFYLLSPARVLASMHISFNSPDKINNLVLKQFKAAIIFFLFLLLVFWFYNSVYFDKFFSVMQKALVNLSGFLGSNLLFAVSIIYLIIMYYLAVTHYDLGYDEAWYIHWSKNFATGGVAFYTTDGKISIIDTITMLPYYLLSAVLFRIGIQEVWQFKLFSSVLSVIALFSVFSFVKKTAGKVTAVLSLAFLILQPGFGFITSSYFGEMFQAVFLLAGIYLWLFNNDAFSDKKILYSALLFSLAIHTKFQLLIILVLVFLLFGLIEKNSRAYRILLYTLLFTAIIGILRLIPVILTDPKQIRYLLIMDWLSGNSITQSLSFTAIEKVQLFNRFFPVPVFCIIIFGSFIYLKKPFEKFLTIYSLVAVLWWVFLFPYTTYRHPFIAIITLCVLGAILSVNLYNKLIDSKMYSQYLIKYVSVFAISFLILYGFSTNLIYAYIGYNDGVQFDLDGFKNRLFSKIEYDNSQKLFYERLKSTVNPGDTIYNGSFVTRFYMNNPEASIISMKSSLSISDPVGNAEKLFLITRENYPLGFEKIYKELDSAGLQKRLILKTGDNELWGIKK